MSRYDWLLFLHVLSAFAVAAAVVVYTFLLTTSRNFSTPSDVLRVVRVSRVANVLSNVGGLGVLVFGIWLAIDVDEYQPWDAWIIAAYVLWALFGAIDGRSTKGYRAARERARSLAGQGQDSPSSELGALLSAQTRLALHLALVVVLLLFLVDMIFKPGA